MKFIIKNIFIGIIAFGHFNSSWAQSSQKSNSYQRKPVGIETRWAKLVDPSNTLPEYPRPQMVRANWQNLNGLWDYAITNNVTNTPNKFDGKILVPFPLESSLSGVKKRLTPDKLLWYRRDIGKPVLKVGERVLLHFGAVDYKATVWLNDKIIGQHTGGYQNFSFDITDFLTLSKNILKVKVWDPSDQGPNPHGKQVLSPANIFYTPSSGIWQTVWLEIVPTVHIESLTVRPDIDKGVLNLIVKGTKGKYSVQVYDKGKEIAFQADNNVGINTEIKIPNAKLWSPDEPFLYDLKVRLGKDEITGYFGMRKISIGKDEQGVDRILLNNKYTYNLGMLDQGFWPDGLYTSPTDEALEFDIKAIKAMGFNTIRKHIKVEPARWYYHADKLGMLVWQDMVNPGNDQPEGRAEFEKECAENIQQLYNNPCIVTWVLFNEKWGQYDQERLTKWIKQVDPDRLINGHSGEYLYVNHQLRSLSPNAYIGADMTDVHSYPIPMMSLKQSGQAQVCGEFGGIGVPIEDHIWDDLVSGWGYDGVVTPETMKIQYSAMADTLATLEKKGLSGSIYTQPFDVESEQNGLITYDRDVIKLPLSSIQQINAKIWPITSNYQNATNGFSANTASNTNQNFASRMIEYKQGRRDSSFLRNLALLSVARQDNELTTKIVNDYIFWLKSPIVETNLKFIKRFAKSTKNTAFKILVNNLDRAQVILGNQSAERRVIFAIQDDEINPYTKTTKPDWSEIEKSVIGKFGILGEQALLESQVTWAVNNGDWKLFSKVGLVWFNKYASSKTYIDDNILNSLAWTVFDSTDNLKALKIALKYSEKTEKGGVAINIDTYANLLYKLGRKEEAIQLDEKALQIAPDNEDIKNALEKMRKNLKTWSEKNSVE